MKEYHLVRFLMALYPPWWRRRHGREHAELTEQLLADGTASRLGVTINLLVGALRAWAHSRRRTDYLQPAVDPAPWGPVPPGSHRDILGNRGLWPRSEPELLPDEVLLGVIDGTTGSRILTNWPGPITGELIAVACFSIPGGLRGYELRSLVSVVALAGAAWVLARLTHSAPVSVAVTSHGLVIFRRGLLSGRTGRMIKRMPAVTPQLVQIGQGSWQKVRLGDRTLWLTGPSAPMLRWMAFWANHSVPITGG